MLFLSIMENLLNYLSFYRNCDESVWIEDVITVQCIHALMWEDITLYEYDKTI